MKASCSKSWLCSVAAALSFVWKARTHGHFSARPQHMRLPPAWRAQLARRVPPIFMFLVVALGIPNLFLFRESMQLRLQLFTVASCGVWAAHAAIAPTDQWLREIYSRLVIFALFATIAQTIAGAESCTVQAFSWLCCVIQSAIFIVEPTELWLWQRVFNSCGFGALLLVTHEDRGRNLHADVTAFSFFVYFMLVVLRPPNRIWLAQLARMATLNVSLQLLEADDVRQLATKNNATGVSLADPLRPRGADELTDDSHSGSVPKWSANSPMLHAAFSWSWDSMELCDKSSTATDEVLSMACSTTSLEATGPTEASHCWSSPRTRECLSASARPSRSPARVHLPATRLI